MDRTTYTTNPYNQNYAKMENTSLRGLVNWDSGLVKVNRWYDQYAAATRMKNYKAREKQLDQIEEEQFADFNRRQGRNRLLRFLRTPRQRGEDLASLYIRLLMPPIRRVLGSYDRLHQRHRNLQVAFALEIYRVENGKYPEQLGALAPNYLKKIPLDFFTGKNLIYRQTKTGYLLYSVGVNGVDELGRGPEDEPQGDDLVVRMPNPKLHRK